MEQARSDEGLEGNFHNFIKYRGIRRVKKVDLKDAGMEARKSKQGSDNLFISDDEPAGDFGFESDSDSDLAIFNGNDEVDDSDYFRLARNDDNMDADVFYTTRLQSFGSVGTYEEDSESTPDQFDKDYEYLEEDNLVNAPASSSSSEKMISTGAEANKLPKTSQEGFLHWDFHSDKTLPEISEVKGKSSGGLYDPFNPDYSTVDSSDPLRIVKSAPGNKFRDQVKMRHLGNKKLMSLDTIRKYKNNLSCIITDERGNDYIVIGANSEITIFSFNQATGLPNKWECLRFDTRPSFTSTTDRLISTWPYFPHTINFVKTCDDFLGKQILGACLDDGTLMIWFSETLFENMRKHGNDRIQNGKTDESHYTSKFLNLKVKPDFRVKMEASLWGLDFKNYLDTFGNMHYLIAASDNSQSATLLYYHQQDKRFYHIKSHQVLHNIPEISFIHGSCDNEGLHNIRLSCASISGELLIFKFKFRLNHGPLNRDEFEHFKNSLTYYIDSTIEQIETRNEDDEKLMLRGFKRIAFSTPTVVSRILLGEDCWTTKPLNSKYFKEVQSIRAMVGNPWIDEEKETCKVSKESQILQFLFDPVRTSCLGLGACWQYFETPTVSLANSSLEHQESVFDSAKLTTLDDDYRRIHKELRKIHKELPTDCKNTKKSIGGSTYQLPLKEAPADDFLLVSTGKRIAMFRANSLFCCSSTRKIFDLAIPFNSESKFSNRISITHIIPELSCFIAISQQGLLTIMRLCQYRGLYGMRQEHIFPNALSLALGYQGYRTIAGVTIRNMSVSPDYPRYYIYTVYTDGIILTYELTSDQNHDLLLSSI